MPSQHVPTFSILAAVDYSNTSSLVVQEAVDLARQKHAAQLHFLHVNHAPPSEAGQEALHAELLAWLGARLEGSRALVRTLRIVGHEQSGDAAQRIIEMASDLSADIVVVGTHGRKGLERLLLGSVAAAVVQRCGCPVFVVRRKHHEHPAVQIEPPCPSCVDARAESGGKVFWCDQHGVQHGRRHTYFDPRASSWVNERMLP